MRGVRQFELLFLVSEGRGPRGDNVFPSNGQDLLYVYNHGLNYSCILVHQDMIQFD